MIFVSVLATVALWAQVAYHTNEFNVHYGRAYDALAEYNEAAKTWNRLQSTFDINKAETQGVLDTEEYAAVKQGMKALDTAIDELEKALDGAEELREDLDQLLEEGMNGDLH